MRHRIKNILAWSIIPQVILVKWLGSYPNWIEEHYSLGLYTSISSVMRNLYGWIPFSIGDCAYIGLTLIALYMAFKNISHLRKKPWKVFRDVMGVLAVAYGSFHLLWGMNYYRVPLEKALEIDSNFSDRELLDLTTSFINYTNTLQEEITGDTLNPVIIPFERRQIFDRVQGSYKDLSKDYPKFAYNAPALKTSLISYVLTIMGYSGYLNPFTNEAQVNRLIPKFRLPVVSAHEVAHQLGYSAENEANLIGYLAVSRTKDLHFKYTASAYALGYLLNEIRRNDELLYNELLLALNQGVILNYEELRQFWESYKNPAEPIFKQAFSTFLKANNQRDGIASYSRVVGLLIGYHRQNPLPEDFR